MRVMTLLPLTLTPTCKKEKKSHKRTRDGHIPLAKRGQVRGSIYRERRNIGRKKSGKNVDKMDVGLQHGRVGKKKSLGDQEQKRRKGQL